MAGTSTTDKRLKIRVEDVVSLTTLGILIVQVILLVALTRKVMALEQIFTQVAGGGPRPTPVVVERIPDERGYALGPAIAPITVVEFSDFQCPSCAQANPVVKELLAKYPDRIRFVYRHFPLTDIHVAAFRAAEASECAGEQDQGKFWEMHDLLFARQSALEQDDLESYAKYIDLDMDQFDECLTSGRMKNTIMQDVADGQHYKVNGTPTFFVNNVMVVSFSELEASVQEALTKR
jgi:protein-disulfide isomerase